jgi:hypothetical protein
MTPLDVRLHHVSDATVPFVYHPYVTCKVHAMHCLHRQKA